MYLYKISIQHSLIPLYQYTFIFRCSISSTTKQLPTHTSVVLLFRLLLLLDTLAANLFLEGLVQAKRATGCERGGEGDLVVVWHRGGGEWEMGGGGAGDGGGGGGGEGDDRGQLVQHAVRVAR